MLATMDLTLRCLALVVVVEEGYGAQPAPCLTVVLHPQHSPLLLWPLPLPLPLLLVPLALPPLMPRNGSNSSSRSSSNSTSSEARSHTAVHKGSQAALSLIHNSLTR